MVNGSLQPQDRQQPGKVATWQTAAIRLCRRREIYAELRLYKNFCLPTIRLKSKERVDGRIKRKYDQPTTPYQRLMESNQIADQTKRELRKIYESLNPAALYRRITTLREQLEEASAGKLEGYGKPSYRGPEIRISKRRNPVAATA